MVDAVNLCVILQLPVTDIAFRAEEAELGRIKAESVTLDDHLAVVAETLGAPHEHLRMEAISLTLNRRRVKVEEGSHPSAGWS